MNLVVWYPNDLPPTGQHNRNCTAGMVDRFCCMVKAGVVGCGWLALQVNEP